MISLWMTWAMTQSKCLCGILAGNEIVEGLLAVVASPDSYIYDTHRINHPLNCKQCQLLGKLSILDFLLPVRLTVTLQSVSQSRV